MPNAAIPNVIDNEGETQHASNYRVPAGAPKNESPEGNVGVALRYSNVKCVFHFWQYHSASRCQNQFEHPATSHAPKPPRRADFVAENLHGRRLFDTGWPVKKKSSLGLGNRSMHAKALYRSPSWFHIPRGTAGSLPPPTAKATALAQRRPTGSTSVLSVSSV